MTPTATFVGIDIAKADFVVACRPDSTSWTAPNDAPGITATVARVRALAPSRIVLEASGGYDTPLVAALAAAGLPVVVANPRQVRDCAKATGPPRSSASHPSHAIAGRSEASVSCGVGARPCGPCCTWARWSPLDATSSFEPCLSARSRPASQRKSR